MARVPIASLFPRLDGAHARYNTRVSNVFEDRVEVSTNTNSPYGFRTILSGKGTFGNWGCLSVLLGAGIMGAGIITRGWLHYKLESCNAWNSCPILTEEEANALIPGVDGWKLVNNDGKLKLCKSWRVKSYSKGLEFVKLVSDVAKEKGRSSSFYHVFEGENLVGWNTVTITIWTKAVDGLTEEDFKLALKFNKLDVEHLLSRTDRLLDLLKRKAATISP